MQDLINPNIRSIIHILNNWNFTFDGSYVKANLEIHITKEELESVRLQLTEEMEQKRKKGLLTDEEQYKYGQAIYDLSFAINELDINNGSNQQ